MERSCTGKNIAIKNVDIYLYKEIIIIINNNWNNDTDKSKRGQQFCFVIFVKFFVYSAEAK
jgi:hypothetical protein